MKLVIDISNEDYRILHDGVLIINRARSNGKSIDYRLLNAIKNGKPLPKGHGRIGDLSKVFVKLNEVQIEGTEEYKGLGKAKQIICDADTIIEADKESET